MVHSFVGYLVMRGFWGIKIRKSNTAQVPCKITSGNYDVVSTPCGSDIVTTRLRKKISRFTGIDDVFSSSRGSTNTINNLVKVPAAAIVTARFRKKISRFTGIDDVFSSYRGSTNTINNLVKVPAARGSAAIVVRVPKKILKFAGIDNAFISSREFSKTWGNFLKVNHLSTKASLDLGTTTSKIAAYGEKDKVAFSIPSAVSFISSCQVVVGQHATEMKFGDAILMLGLKSIIGKKFGDPIVQPLLDRFPFEYKIVKGIDGEAFIEAFGQIYSPISIMALLISNLKIEAEHRIGEDISTAILHVRASLDDVNKEAMLKACKIASLDVKELVLEPISAAKYHGLMERPGRFVLIIDYGGGSLDTTVLQISESGAQVKAANSNYFLGGMELDKQLLDFFVEKIKTKYCLDFSGDVRALQKLSMIIESAKIRLSSRWKASLKFKIATSYLWWSVPQFGYKRLNYIPTEPGVKEHMVTKDLENSELLGEGLGFMYGLPFAYFLTKIRLRSVKVLRFMFSRAELDNQLNEFIEKAKHDCLSTITTAGLTMEEIDEVLLVGGMGLVPLVEKEFRKMFDRNLIRGDAFSTVLGSSNIHSTAQAQAQARHLHLWEDVKSYMYVHVWGSVKVKFSKIKIPYFSKSPIHILDDEDLKNQALFFEKYMVELRALHDIRRKLLDLCSEARRCAQEKDSKLEMEIIQVEESLNELERRVHQMLQSMYVAKEGRPHGKHT